MLTVIFLACPGWQASTSPDAITLFAGAARHVAGTIRARART
jgi:hypothetical protein